MDGHIVGARFNLFEPEDISVLRKRMCEFVASNSHRSRFARISLMHSLLNFIFDFRAPHVLCDHAVR